MIRHRYQRDAATLGSTSAISFEYQGGDSLATLAEMWLDLHSEDAVRMADSPHAFDIVNLSNTLTELVEASPHSMADVAAMARKIAPNRIDSRTLDW